MNKGTFDEMRLGGNTTERNPEIALAYNLRLDKLIAAEKRTLWPLDIYRAPIEVTNSKEKYSPERIRV